MGKFWKFWLAIAGNAVGIAVVALAYAGVADCTNISDASTCTVFGYSTAQVTGFVLTIFNSAFVLFGPKNAG